MPDKLETKLDELGHAIEESQKSLSKGLKDTSDNAAKHAANIANSIQEQDLRLKAIEEESLMIQKQLARVGNIQSDRSKECIKEYNDKLALYLKSGVNVDTNLEYEYTKEIIKDNFYGMSKDKEESVIKSMVSGSNPEGGYLIRPDYSTDRIARVFETSPMRFLASIVSTNSNLYVTPIFDQQAGAANWVGEVDERPVTGTPKIGQLEIAIHALEAKPLVTQDFLDDAGVDIESWLLGEVSDRFTRTENTSFVSGDGSKKPKGFLTYPDYTTAQKNDSFGAYGRGAVEQIISGVNGEITGDGLKNIQNSLKEFYQSNATWGIRRKDFEQIITLKDNQDRYIFNTRFLQEERTLSLLGRPVVFMNDLPDAATDSLSMVYGDFKRGYRIVDRFGMRVIRDVYSNKPFIELYSTKRVGGAVYNYEALKLLKLSA